MSTKTTKLLASSLSVALLATMVTLPAAAATTSTQLSGLNRYETSLKIVQAGWEKGSSANVVIASGEAKNMADSLAAAPLAYKMGEAPILLTKSDAIPAGVLEELVRLGVKKVTIVGGTGAVSAAVEAKIKATGVTVERVSGANRFETSLEIAKKAFGTASTEVVIANGLASSDALSVSAIAARKGMPILLVNNKLGLTVEQKAYIAGKTVYAIGGTSVVSEAVAGTATRLSGANRYETNAAILAKFAPDYSNIFLAKGTDANLVDSLVGSAYAAKGNNPVVLVDAQNGINAKLITEVTKNIKADSKIVRLGGMVTEATANAVEAMKAKDLSVASVKAINATQVEVKFTKAVDEDSLFDADGDLIAGTVALTSIDGMGGVTLSGSLSEDGKTLTVTASSALSKRYNVVVNNLVATDKTALTKYDEIVNFAADITAPTVVSTTKISASTYKVKFSEPMSTLGTVSYTLADGSSANVTNNFAGGPKTEVIFTLDAGIAAGKIITTSFIGALDQASNLLTPTPATVTFVKGALDGVVPTVASITQTDAKKFVVKFSEELLVNPTVVIAGNTIVSYTKDDTDPTKYTVLVTNVLNGATTVAISGLVDLSGETATATSRVFSFVKDIAIPTVVSSAVSVDATDRMEYLEITFNKDVVLASNTITATGSYVKDYVTTTGLSYSPAVAYKTTTNKKVVRVALADITAASTKGAIYTLDLALANVTSQAGILAANAKATFTRGEDGIAANAEVLAAPTVAPNANNNNKVNVTFTGAVDGASATNTANYLIGGAVVESVSLQPLYGGTQVAVLNLKAGSNTFTGVRNIKVSNVKALGSSKVMVPYTVNNVVLKENVAPTVTSAKLTSTNTITLTFSETVTNGSGNDFEIYLAGVAQDVAEEKNVSISGSTITITVATIDAAKLAKGISLKALAALDIIDAAGNKVSAPTNIAVVQ